MKITTHTTSVTDISAAPAEPTPNDHSYYLRQIQNPPPIEEPPPIEPPPIERPPIEPPTEELPTDPPNEA